MENIKLACKWWDDLSISKRAMLMSAYKEKHTEFKAFVETITDSQIEEIWFFNGKTEESIYNLSFHDAIDIILNEGVVKGSRFRDGIFMKLNNSGQIVTVDAARLYNEETTVFFKSISTQKFRELSVMTMKELSF